MRAVGLVPSDTGEPGCRQPLRLRPIDFKGGDPDEFVWSAKMARQHYSESVRAFCAAQRANKRYGGAAYRSANLQTDTATLSQADAARLARVSTRLVATAVTRADSPPPVE
jgi:hypothetical protein